MENLIFLFKIASNFVGEYKIIIKYLAEAIKFFKNSLNSILTCDSSGSMRFEISQWYLRIIVPKPLKNAE